MSSLSTPRVHAGEMNPSSLGKRVNASVVVANLLYWAALLPLAVMGIVRYGGANRQGAMHRAAFALSIVHGFLGLGVLAITSKSPTSSAGTLMIEELQSTYNAMQLGWLALIVLGDFLGPASALAWVMLFLQLMVCFYWVRDTSRLQGITRLELLGTALLSFLMISLTVSMLALTMRSNDERRLRAELIRRASYRGHI